MTADEEWDEGTPERLYILTGGRSGSEDAGLDLVTLIVARTPPRIGMQPEHESILRVCESPLSVVEISAHLELPVSIVTVLLADLLAEEHVEARAPAPSLPDIDIIKAVIHGLQNL
ncbi:DUF742 domain-containing protein [Streptomyces spirodelae]|uniref:DUF742 domain-containing protein n=1 Tax=Streptomyces spirodelae TaxID=2812904 RepID=A0ABS3WPF5_9ACTN|nr:DUF742 domain-containing protein [Streptomyces spirodelae]MBO8185010.1 DUF742 domain-containing protein [Streptomyces spirodelae]